MANILCRGFASAFNSILLRDKPDGLAARFAIAALSVGVFGLASPAQADAMLMPGAFDVSSGGAASYSIPISVPPGTGGMVPPLSLDYSSQGGNGLVGMGWGLSGLPAIGRCPKTMAQDSARGSVNYDLNDRFCMEGQRLILISGTYGAAGSEYRTELEGFSKITASGTVGNGPASFTVKTKSGQTMDFGNTTDSRVLAQGKTTARSWAINKITDTKGNYLTVTYTNDTTNGQAYPTRIDYTGNASASLATYNSVQFVYETRPDITPMYHAGSLQKTTVRLIDVQTYQAASLVSDYKIAYGVSPSSGRSRVTSIKVCADAALSNCLPATTYSYLDKGVLPSAASGNFAGFNGLEQYAIPGFADFNGDGSADIFWSQANAYGLFSSSRLWLSSAGTVGGSYQTPISVAAAFPLTAYTSTPAGHYFGDFTGDGKTDILWGKIDSNGNVTGASGGAGLKFWKSNGDGTFAVTAPAQGISDGSLPFVGDFNGDGRADILWRNYGAQTCSFWNGNTGIPDSRILWMSNGDGTFAVTTNVNGSDGAMGTCNTFGVLEVTTISDFNGDGKADILWTNLQNSAGTAIAGSQRILWTSNGDGTFQSKIILGDFNDYPTYLVTSVYSGFIANIGDFNGDGKSDLFFFKSSTQDWGVWLSKGDGTFDISTKQTNTALDKFYPSVADFNGDGESDILWFNATTNARLIWQSNGDGTFTTTTTNLASQNGTNAGTIPYIVDINGDSKADIMWDYTDIYGRTIGSRNLWQSDGSISDLMASFTTGSALTTSLIYKPLTDSAVYTKETTGTYPVLDVRMPSYAVNRVNAANGIGGTYSSIYNYIGAKVDLNGRGFLGFRQRWITDAQTLIQQVTTYRQDYPYIGLATSEVKVNWSNSMTLNSTTNTYTATSLGGTRYFVGLTGSVASSKDLDGTVIPAVTTSYTYDAYGNATQVTMSTPDGASKTTTNTYTNDTTNWYLGRLTGASVTSIVP